MLSGQALTEGSRVVKIWDLVTNSYPGKGTEHFYGHVKTRGLKINLHRVITDPQEAKYLTEKERDSSFDDNYQWRVGMVTNRFPTLIDLHSAADRVFEEFRDSDDIFFTPEDSRDLSEYEGYPYPETDREEFDYAVLWNGTVVNCDTLPKVSPFEEPDRSMLKGILPPESLKTLKQRDIAERIIKFLELNFPVFEVPYPELEPLLHEAVQTIYKLRGRLENIKMIAEDET